VSRQPRQPRPRNAAEAYRQKGPAGVVWAIIMLVIIIGIAWHLASH
jgi:hypothetical protein